MKINAPHDWRPGDERYYSFSRSSGLPVDYFHGSARRAWRMIAALAVALIFLFACTA